jgi:hypothetical protein
MYNLTINCNVTYTLACRTGVMDSVQLNFMLHRLLPTVLLLPLLLLLLLLSLLPYLCGKLLITTILIVLYVSIRTLFSKHNIWLQLFNLYCCLNNRPTSCLISSLFVCMSLLFHSLLLLLFFVCFLFVPHLQMAFGMLTKHINK